MESVLTFVLVLGVWTVLQVFVFPKLGVPT
jgi:uncharacterized membrane protein